ncbi:hypothetical protein BDW66DRAFT_159455 [Aspergillus desertorum]
MIARRTSLLAIVFFVVVIFVIFSSSPRPVSLSEAVSEEISAAVKYVPKFPSLSDLHLPTFQPPAHTPPESQQDSSSGDSKWFSRWAWLNPYSSSITLDENRSVLPPLPNRPYIFTYYNPKKGSDMDEGNSDAQLLFAWRRAWYAHGFRPVVLGHVEAMANPLYESVKRLGLSSELEEDFFKWLAWGHMGDGLLADWLCFPMARYDDPTLSHLRRGADPDSIARFDKTHSALLFGKKSTINAAIENASTKDDKSAKSLTDLIPDDLLKTEPTNSLAIYDSATIAAHYHELTEKLIPLRIAVLKPFAEHTTALVEPALRLAKALGQCPDSVARSSCPPNLPDCHPCNARKPMKITQPATYKNTTQVFTIGTLPHPYTLISLLQNSSEVTARHIRRETPRDAWLKEVTGDQMGHQLGGGTRAVLFKRVVADVPAIGTSLWMTAESLSAEINQALPSDFPTISMQHANPSKQGVEREYTIIQQARDMLKKQTNSDRVNIRGVVEAWNMADTEVWRFVKAYRARSDVERKKWEEEEKSFFGTRPQI